jgi:hypothetical protein
MPRRLKIGQPKWLTQVTSLESSRGIATGYWADICGGVRAEVPAEQCLSLLHSVHTAYGAHPTPYPIVTRG